METVLNIPELVHIILEHIVSRPLIRSGPQPSDLVLDKKEYSRGWQTIHSSLRVSRLVCEKAICILWKELPDTRASESLLLESFGGDIVGPWSNSFIHSPGSPDYYLKNFSTVKWRGDFDETEFTLLFSSNLNSIIINSSGSTPPIFPSRLSAYSHSLRALAILNDQGCSMLIPNLPLPAALNLTTLIIPRIQIHDFELLLQISYLPKLTTASLAIDALTTVSPPKSTVQVTPQFPNLRSLTLSATTTMATRSLDSITGSPRYTLEILLTHTERLLTHDVVSLIENIGRLLPLSLTELAIKVEGQVATVESEHHDQPLTAMHLAPLRKFDALELLDLYLPCIFDVCDADISTLCHAFTKLQRPEIMSDSSIGPYPPNLTPASLQIVSKAAPQLLSLSQCFKAEWPTDYKQDLSPSVSSLESLDVGSSKLQQQVGYYDQSNVEKTLRHLFPKLRWIWWTHPFYFLEDLDDINWDDAPVDHVEYRDIGYTWERIGNKLGGWSPKGLCPFLYE